MKAYAKLIFAATFILGMGLAAKADVPDAITVTVPFEFAVSGKTLPADIYTVDTVSDRFGPLLLTGRNNRNSVFLIPFQSKSVSSSKPHLSFEQIAGKHLLRNIETKGEVYSIRVTSSANQAASDGVTRQPHCAAAAGEN